ncbi:hypothetical protein VNI00_013254 [Paramarasmius palmivorus]|uniref:Major facilitator superfamily (MFS) profile domain-containing protein n=1 Tax=Paramarasmius palmivorus TaxID=297713 RepID=A0AAW0C1T8_9AGAR
MDKKTASERADLNGNIVAVLQGGCFFGALAMGYFSRRFGRKKCLLASGVIYIIGSTIQSIAGLGSSQEVGLSVLYFSRFLGGIGVGMVSALVPSYVSECTPRAIRGRCTSMIQLANNVGIMLSFWVNYSASKDMAPTQMQWRMPFIIQLPESPRWLVEHGKLDAAARSLAHVAGVDPDEESVQATIREIREEFEGKDHLSLWQQFLGMGESWSIAHRCFIPSLVMFFQQWTGTNAINYFSPEIFAGLGVDGTTAGLFATGIYGVVKVVAVGLVIAFAVESLGRKKCLIYGGLGQALMMLWIGGYSGIHRSDKIVPASYVSLVAVYLYAIFYCVGWGPIPWAVSAEVAPNHLRTMALSVAVGVNWLFSFTISKITPIMLNNITYGTFLLFGVMCLIMSFWAYAFFPETKGVALEDIKYLFGDKWVVRSLQDAPLGRVFLGGKTAEPIEELRRKDDGLVREDSSVKRLDMKSAGQNDHPSPI